MLNPCLFSRYTILQRSRGTSCWRIWDDAAGQHRSGLRERVQVVPDQSQHGEQTGDRAYYKTAVHQLEVLHITELLQEHLKGAQQQDHRLRQQPPLLINLSGRIRRHAEFHNKSWPSWRHHQESSSQQLRPIYRSSLVSHRFSTETQRWSFHHHSHVFCSVTRFKALRFGWKLWLVLF